ncbi:hypothetical protein EVAR_84406_1 [Eumeta japonica]|uniref:Uncharacterized protein n=1 Tax=Eumeta variegata TaxID=151549 RepID=A0A4C1YH87_EUMVA|nr:hypothetical protein EVAR_84406_1 [Eumeta japonica]
MRQWCEFSKKCIGHHATVGTEVTSSVDVIGSMQLSASSDGTFPPPSKTIPYQEDGNAVVAPHGIESVYGLRLRIIFWCLSYGLRLENAIKKRSAGQLNNASFFCGVYFPPRWRTYVQSYALMRWSIRAPHAMRRDKTECRSPGAGRDAGDVYGGASN